MLFNSYPFLLFFPLVVLIYFIVPKKAQRLWLLLASYYFYMSWDAKYIVLLVFVTLLSYIAGRLLEHRKMEKIRKGIVAGVCVCCFLVLGCFKYFDFLLSSLNELLGIFQVSAIVSPIHFLLPVGISFYTFQAVGYVVDVYRGDTEAEHDLVTYALFVAFFPQLVAGPIERSKNLLGQVRKVHTFSFESLREGFLIMLWGFFLKLVIADRTAVFVDAVYNDYHTYGGVYLILATILFGIQIYCDFAGYSTIAVGAAHVLGIHLMENFEAPYFATSVSAFWRRWHISLTSWFRDYLYIPLGGNRKGKIRKYCNIVVVFFTSGLWHGADWSFVIWGGLNGIYQVIGAVFSPVRKKVAQLMGFSEKSLGGKLLQGIVTFSLVDFAWIFFRASNMKEAFEIIGSMFSIHNPWILWDGSLYQLGLNQHNFTLMLLAIGILACVDYMKQRGYCIRNVILQQDTWCRWLCYLVGIFTVVILGRYGASYGSTFIYFQF